MYSESVNIVLIVYTFSSHSHIDAISIYYKLGITLHRILDKQQWITF